MDLSLIFIAAGISLIMAMAWLIQQMSKSSALVDTLWTIAVGAGGIAAALLPGPGTVERRIAVGVLVAVWAIRLGLHIARRNASLDDDPRYAKLTRDWGKNAPFFMFIFLQIQALAAFILVLAVRLAAVNPAAFPSLQDIAGALILIASIAGEAVADAQLAQFGRTHKGGICDVGLWQWSRHPNYFFEWLGWVGWAVIAIDATNAWTCLALLAPAQMYYLLVYASGIPPLEQHMIATRGEPFRAYQARTSAFFPLPPKLESKG